MIIDTRHYEYDSEEMEMYRLIKNNDEDYITKYLEHYTLRESATSFSRRKRMTYSPAYAKADVGEIQLSIINRLTDVRRESSDSSYIQAIDGNNGGVDNTGSSMNQFIGSKVLDEMLFMRRVGVFVDMTSVPVGATKADVSSRLHPYCYTYKSEDILTWTYDAEKRLTHVLLRYEEDVYSYGLTAGRETRYRLLAKTTVGVSEVTYDKNGKEIEGKVIDGLEEVPFFIAELSQSILKDVARQQNTLLNLASSDIHYCFESNFPFYTEQEDPSTSAFKNVPKNTVAETSRRENEEKDTAEPEILDIGPTRGRKYAPGMDRPDFIHPSSEPLKASMEKQASIRAEIRTLLHLSLSGVTNAHATVGDRGLNYGLKAIGDELEKLERFIMRIWSYYMSTSVGGVYYPEDYSLKTPEERLKEAAELIQILKTSPSKTFQREMQKKVISLLFLSNVDHDTLKTMYSEIENSDILFVDPEDLRLDVETGLVTTNTASTIRGYDAGEAELAMKQRVERAAATIAAQANVAQKIDGAARGVKDLETEVDQNSAKIEKQVSQSPTVDNDSKKRVRS